jgi:hypothetical protein
LWGRIRSRAWNATLKAVQTDRMSGKYECYAR